MTPVSTRTEETCATWIECSERPNQRGVWWTMDEGVIWTWVGKR